MKYRRLLFFAVSALIFSIALCSTITAEDHGSVVESGPCGDNLTWTIYEDGLLVISGTGEMKDYGGEYNSALQINVTHAPWSTHRTSIKMLEIQEGVTSISTYAFAGCDGLTGGLIIPDSVKTIGRYAFANCSFKGNLKIGDSVTEIGYRAFYICSGFSGSLIIPDSVASIDQEAFRECHGFTGSLTIGNGMKTIGREAFCNCGFGGNLSIGNSVETILYRAFEGTHFSGNLTIPASVTRIEQDAFMGVFDYIRFMGDAPSVEDPGFHSPAYAEFTIFYQEEASGWTTPRWHGYCSAVDLGNLDDENLVSAGRCGDNLMWYLYDDGVLEIIGEGAMYQMSPWRTGAHALKTLKLNEGLTTIGYGAFENCNSFTGNLSIPESVTKIEDRAFSSCTGFTGDLMIPDCVTAIGENAFYGDSGFTSLTISGSVTSIGKYAFYGCSNIAQDLIIPCSIEAIGESAFYYCSGVTKSIFEGDAPEEFGNRVFDRCARGFVIQCYSDHADSFMQSESYDATAETWYGYPLVILDGDEVLSFSPFSDYYLSDDGSLLFGVAAQTTYNDFISNFMNLNLVIHGNDGRVISETYKGFIGTGFTLSIVKDGISIVELTVVISGELNGDGEINATDRMIIARFIAGWNGYRGRIKVIESADLNKDGEITAIDRVILSRFLAGWEGYEVWFD